MYQDDTLDTDAAEKEAEKLMEQLKKKLNGKRDWLADRKELQSRMTLNAGHLRCPATLDKALREARSLVLKMEEEGYPYSAGEHALINFQLAFAHWGYLSAIKFQADSGVGSRGSGAIIDEQGNIQPENPEFRKKILETRFEDGEFTHKWIDCRPIPHEDGWFETIWAEFRNKDVYSK
jgi:hypothetical protein